MKIELNGLGRGAAFFEVIDGDVFNIRPND
jgi:hypothetical protein